MTLSPLSEPKAWPLGKTPSGQNRFTARPGKPSMFIVHHAAGTSDDGLKSQYVAKHRELSSNYAMTRDARIIPILHDEYRPFTSSSSKADGRAITIEIVNHTAAPEWRGSDEQFDKLARLIADRARYWNFPVNRSTVIMHREVLPRFGQGIATACPGPWWVARFDALVALAARYAAGVAPATPVRPAQPAPAPVPTEEEEMSAAAEDIKNAVRREARPRLIERKSTGEMMLVKITTGYRRSLTRAEAEAWVDQPIQLITAEEWQRHPAVTDDEWDEIIAEADGQLARIAKAAALFV